MGTREGGRRRRRARRARGRQAVVLGCLAALVGLGALTGALGLRADGPATSGPADAVGTGSETADQLPASEGDPAEAATQPPALSPSNDTLRLLNRARAPSRPRPVEVADSASGHYRVVGGRAGTRGSGEVVRYLVETEKGLPFDGSAFAAEVDRILNHEYGWGRDGRDFRFQRVAEGPVRFRVSLSSPDTTDRQCYPLLTRGRVSCFNGERTVINARRWGQGSDTYGDDLRGYREYLISHEVGHALGHGHRNCPEPGAPAPTMVQQTKSLEGCAANPWPHPPRP